MARVVRFFTHINLKHCSLVIEQQSRCFNLHTVSNKCRTFSCRSYRAIGLKSTMTKATGNRLSWKLTADGIKKSADELIATHKKIWDGVSHVKPAEVTFENVIKVTLL